MWNCMTVVLINLCQSCSALFCYCVGSSARTQGITQSWVRLGCMILIYFCFGSYTLTLGKVFALFFQIPRWWWHIWAGQAIGSAPYFIGFCGCTKRPWRHEVAWGTDGGRGRRLYSLFKQIPCWQRHTFFSSQGPGSGTAVIASEKLSRSQTHRQNGWFFLRKIRCFRHLKSGRRNVCQGQSSQQPSQEQPQGSVTREESGGA